MPRWNGYVIEVDNAAFSFNCRHCDFKMNEIFKDTVDLKKLRETWKAHVETHGGPYG